MTSMGDDDWWKDKRSRIEPDGGLGPGIDLDICLLTGVT